ncbi:hypothetical protein FACS1894171_2350 [Clostridia bacterium]|nr:hypothetical protein FACS1894171_2350 [Clostridia bacterium]
MGNVLEMRNISKAFRDVEVLSDISLSVTRGSVLAIIGPSGSGKSTLLRCATMLETIDSGEIKYIDDILVAMKNGKPVYCGKAMEKKIKSHFGLVFQNFNLFPHFSALRNITEAPIHVAKQDPKKARETAIGLLEKMGLSDKAGAYPYQLSGGQQQRLAIARALALSPDMLFFDEPTSALDPELTGEILKVIRALAAERMTMVIVTHEMSFARDVADHVIFMDGGLVVEQGLPKDIINNPQNPRTHAFDVLGHSLRVNSFVPKIPLVGHEQIHGVLRRVPLVLGKIEVEDRRKSQLFANLYLRQVQVFQALGGVQGVKVRLERGQTRLVPRGHIYHGLVEVGHLAFPRALGPGAVYDFVDQGLELVVGGFRQLLEYPVRRFVLGDLAAVEIFLVDGGVKIVLQAGFVQGVNPVEQRVQLGGGYLAVNP